MACDPLPLNHRPSALKGHFKCNHLYLWMACDPATGHPISQAIWLLTGGGGVTSHPKIQFRRPLRNLSTKIFSWPMTPFPRSQAISSHRACTSMVCERVSGWVGSPASLTRSYIARTTHSRLRRVYQWWEPEPNWKKLRLSCSLSWIRSKSNSPGCIRVHVGCKPDNCLGISVSGAIKSRKKESQTLSAPATTFIKCTCLKQQEHTHVEDAPLTRAKIEIPSWIRNSQNFTLQWQEQIYYGSDVFVLTILRWEPVHAMFTRSKYLSALQNKPLACKSEIFCPLSERHEGWQGALVHVNPSVSHNTATTRTVPKVPGRVLVSTERYLNFFFWGGGGWSQPACCPLSWEHLVITASQRIVPHLEKFDLTGITQSQCAFPISDVNLWNVAQICFFLLVYCSDTHWTNPVGHLKHAENAHEEQRGHTHPDLEPTPECVWRGRLGKTQVCMSCWCFHDGGGYMNHCLICPGVVDNGQLLWAALLTRCSRSWIRTDMSQWEGLWKTQGFLKAQFIASWRTTSKSTVYPASLCQRFDHWSAPTKGQPVPTEPCQFCCIPTPTGQAPDWRWVMASSQWSWLQVQLISLASKREQSPTSESFVGKNCVNPWWLHSLTAIVWST